MRHHVFLLSGNDIISLKSRPLIFLYLYRHTQSIQKQIVEYNTKGKYPEQYTNINKVESKKTFNKEILLHVEVIASSFLILSLSKC